MAGLDFSTEELLEQARGNQTAIWHLAARWAKARDGSVAQWAAFVGEDFAPSWDDLGENASALEVARIAALNIATTADMKPVDLSGDDSQAVVTAEGPEQQWIDNMSTSIEDLDGINEVIFSAIARRRGLNFTQTRNGNSFEMRFAK